MAFQYLTGQTTAGAPDEVANWFSTFQQWIEGVVGWTVVSGGGTKNLVIRSPGEDGSYDQLYAHIWESAPGTVRAEVQDDAGATHATAEGGTLLSGAAQFTYFMSANLEAISIVFKTAVPNWTWIYVGCVMPFALKPPDETYTMIASANRINACSVLRNHDDTWDVDIVLRDNDLADNFDLCGLDNSFTLTGMLAGTTNGIVGQLHHVSGEVGPASGLALEDTITTLASAYRTTDWIVLRDAGADWFAMRTGGDLPVGLPDNRYAYQTGIALDYTDFIVNHVSPFLLDRGWIDLGDPGLDDVGRLFYSTGESRQDDIFIVLSYHLPVNSFYQMYVQNDAVGTHRTPAAVFFPCDRLTFPTRYHLGGDADCLLWTIEAWQGAYPNWMGMARPGNPNAPGSEYSVLCASFYLARVRLLRDHTGAWTPGTGYFYRDVKTTTSPNLFDGETCILWPVGALGLGPGGGVFRDFHGTLKYLYQVDGYYCCPGDTIQVADRSYLVLSYGGADSSWAIRTE